MVYKLTCTSLNVPVQEFVEPQNVKVALIDAFIEIGAGRTVKIARHRSVEQRGDIHDYWLVFVENGGSYHVVEVTEE